MIESQNHRKLVIRKFAIFSSGLIFKAKLFLVVLQDSTEQRIFITLEYTQKKEITGFKKISLKTRPELKIANFLNSILQIFRDSVIQSLLLLLLKFISHTKNGTID